MNNVKLENFYISLIIFVSSLLEYSLCWLISTIMYKRIDHQLLAWISIKYSILVIGVSKDWYYGEKITKWIARKPETPSRPKKTRKNIELDIGRPGETGKVLLSHGRSSGSKNIWKKREKAREKGRNDHSSKLRTAVPFIIGLPLTRPSQEIVCLIFLYSKTLAVKCSYVLQLLFVLNIFF
jgi:hypothetical protein